MKKTHCSNQTTEKGKPSLKRNNPGVYGKQWALSRTLGETVVEEDEKVMGLVK